MSKLLAITTFEFEGYTEHFDDAFVGSNDKPGEIALAFYGGMWAYDGWYVLLMKILQ